MEEQPITDNFLVMGMATRTLAPPAIPKEALFFLRSAGTQRATPPELLSKGYFRSALEV